MEPCWCHRQCQTEKWNFVDTCRQSCPMCLWLIRAHKHAQKRFLQQIWVPRTSKIFTIPLIALSNPKPKISVWVVSKSSQNTLGSYNLVSRRAYHYYKRFCRNFGCEPVLGKKFTKISKNLENLEIFTEKSKFFDNFFPGKLKNQKSRRSGCNSDRRIYWPNISSWTCFAKFLWLLKDRFSGFGFDSAVAQ